MDRIDLHSIQLQILGMVERDFGPRDAAYAVLAPDFKAGRSRIEYPPRDSKFIRIIVPDSAKTDINLAVYHIAHECIHILSPTSYASVTVFEEGLATAFSHECHGSLTGKRMPTSGDAKYDSAMRLVEPILSRGRGIISRMRAEHPNFCDFRSDFISFHTSVAKETADTLASSFANWNP